jgi:DNA modification methylase
MKTTKKSASSPKSKSETRVEIKPAKGRPMLTWVGKKPLRHAIAYPAQLVETYSPSPAFGRGARGEGWPDWPKDIPQTGLLFHGDNKDILAYLLANGFRGKVKLIYIDPPFDSAADYVRKVNLRGDKSVKLEGEGYGLGEQVQYTDIWTNDNYLQFMHERLILLRELLTEDGSIWLHCDWRKSHFLRALLDEVFGVDNFRAQITWRTMTSSGYKGKKSLGRSHADLLYYSKGNDFVYNPVYLEMSEEMRSRYSHVEPDGRRFKDSYLGDVTPTTVEGLRKDNLLYETSTGGYRIKHYLDEADGTLADDVWTDINPENSQSILLTDYPTQKPEALLERVIELTSNYDDIVLDCFLGSGTTAAVAQKLGRRWIGADINNGAIQTTIKRLQGVIQEQALNPQPLLPSMGEGESPRPAQLGFVVYRVNDYDLQIQHNEAFNLAVEHLGMTRTKTDAFFDGTLGKRLVKIVPFNHPITPLDLEEVKKELNNRPDEERDIVVVGLGKEVAVEAWLEEWNKLRKQGNIPNKIEVIELRSDPKYGGFFTHEPAKAKVSFKRTDKGVEITIDDFISPTILERLRQQNKDNPLFQPQVSDWRSMVDSVMIDSAYDGKLFNITLADVPERKNDLVAGKYLVEAKKVATIAVKVTDMLGEEVLVVGEE